MSKPSLLVPMQIDAMVVNSSVSKLPFRRWEMNYQQLERFESPDPPSFDGQTVSNFDTIENQGVYLHWKLPQAFRHGQQNRNTGEIDFPLVPNRWLVVRFYGDLTARQAKAWVVESDCPSENAAESSEYLVGPEIIEAWRKSNDPNRNTVNGHPRPSSDPTSPHMELLGKSYPIEDWSERGIEEMFLTAIAPGNPYFAAYQPHAKNIFSFHDSLASENISKDTLSYMVVGWFSNPKNDPVVKWRNIEVDNTDDYDLYQKAMSDLGWSVKNDSGIIAESSLYHGFVHSIEWEAKGAKPESTVQDVTNLHVSIGNNAIDAFKAMITAQIANKANNSDNIAVDLLDTTPELGKLIEVLLHDSLASLEDNNGAALLAQKIKQSWFESKQSGLLWKIVDKNYSEVSQKDAETRKKESQLESWLVDLNKNQRNFDETSQQLQNHQRNLYSAWWKKCRFDVLSDDPFLAPEGVTTEQFQDALDPLNKNYNASLPEGPDNIYSLTKRIKEYQDDTESQSKLLPRPIISGEGTAEDAFQKGIDSFNENKIKSGELVEDRILKPVSTPRFWKASDPVILINGARNTEQITSKKVLACRLDSQLISLVTINGKELTAKNLSAKIPTVNTAKLPSAISGLATEIYFLDPVNACSMVTFMPSITADDLKAILMQHRPDNYGEYLPDFNLTQWQQLWQPVFVEWAVKWHSIDYMADDGKTQNWAFDGSEYRFKGPLPQDSSLKSKTISGRTFLTAQPSFIFKDRLEKFFRDNPDAGEVADLEDLKKYIDDWDFLCQYLEGFNDMLSMQDNKANRAPDTHVSYAFSDGNKKSLPDLIGDQCHSLPYLPPTQDKFQAIRQGQFSVQSLIVYDNFGQVIEVVGESGLKSSDNFRPILPSELVPDQCLFTKNQFRFTQMPPRLLQHCRLDMQLVDILDSSRYIDSNSNTNPVCAWLLPNHIDKGISLFDNKGISLGELRLIDTGTGKAVKWQPSPHSQYQTMDDLKQASPQLGSMIDSLYQKGKKAFEELLQVIDETLWTIDPLGSREDQNLSVLIGRPLALVRTQLRFMLDGPTIKDTSWKATFSPKEPEFINYQFDIRLGDLEIRKDGLIGYYYLNGNNDYNVFHCVHKPDNPAPNAYIKRIEPGMYITLDMQKNSKADVVMLVDPRASVHAFTGILPVKVLDFPDRFINPVLKRIEVCFQMGPLLTQIEEDIKTKEDSSKSKSWNIGLPYPAEKNGTWSWWESHYANGKETWQSYNLAKVDQKAHMKDTQRTIREGFLQLTVNLEKNK